MPNHPVQPLIKDPDGTIRFLDAGPYDMNHLAICSFPREDRVQFAQLIGYSLCGFGELSYVSDADYDAAESQARLVHEAPAKPPRRTVYFRTKTGSSRLLLKGLYEEEVQEALSVLDGDWVQCSWFRYHFGFLYPRCTPSENPL